MQISIHAPPRGATNKCQLYVCQHIYFNSRPSARGDNARREGEGTAGYFNSRPSARGDNSKQHGMRPHRNFNSRPSARGDKNRATIICTFPSFQFTPLREGRPHCHTFQYIRFAISIHAPPRGATYRNYATQEVNLISIHAPPRGATEKKILRTKNPPNFNSRPSARGDHQRENRRGNPHRFQFTPLREGRPACLRQKHAGRISIHAPPRGATRMDSVASTDDNPFQFTPLREGRRWKAV